MSESDDLAFVRSVATFLGASFNQHTIRRIASRQKGENRPFSLAEQKESKSVLANRAAVNGTLQVWNAAFDRLAQHSNVRDNAIVLLYKILQDQDMLAALSSGERTENRASAANQPTMDNRMLQQQMRGTPPPGRNISVPAHRYLEGDDSVMETHSELNSLELTSPLETIPRPSPMAQQSTPFMGMFKAENVNNNPMFTTHNSAIGSPGMNTVYNTAEEPTVEVEARITLPDAGNLFKPMYEVVPGSAPQHIVEKLQHRPSYDAQLHLTYSMQDDIFMEEPAKESLRGLHRLEQEKKLAKDLIAAFQRHSTSVLELVPVCNDRGNTHYVYAMSAQNSQVAESVLLLWRYVTSRYRPEFGAVCCAFADAVRLLVGDWDLYVATMEKDLMSKGWELYRIETSCQPTVGPLITTAKICAEASSQGAYGASLLNLLHRHSMSVSGNEKKVQAIHMLLKAASVPYFESLTTWVSTGTLHDPYSEFMVVAVPGMNVDMELDGQSAYWVGGHKLRTVEVNEQEETDVPVFLHDIADAVLKAGKNWNVLRLCQQQAASKGGGFDDLVPSAVQQPVRFDSHGGFKKQIQQYYECASASLLKMMLSHFQLKDWLASCKNFFLLHQADYFINFLDSADSELDLEVNVASMGILRGQLEMAVRSSSLAHDPFSDKLQFILDPNSFTDLHTALFHRKTNTKKNAKNVEKMKAADLIMLELDVQWPVSIVLTPHIMRAFQFCFRHLVNVKVVERKLGDKWRQLMQTRKLGRPENDAERNGHELLRRLLALVNRMNTFIHRYLHFLTVEVIDPHWHEMMTKIDQALSIDEVIVLLRECLHKILEVGLLERLRTLSMVVVVYWKCRACCMKVDEAIKNYQKIHYMDATPEQQGRGLTPEMFLKVAMQPGFESSITMMEREFTMAQAKLSEDLKAHKYSAGVNGASADSVADASKLLHQLLEVA